MLKNKRIIFYELNEVPFKVLDYYTSLELLLAAPALGLRGATLARLGGQLIAERVKPEKAVRWRTFQVQIAFDLFSRQLDRARPEFSCFFTNHIV